MEKGVGKERKDVLEQDAGGRKVRKLTEGAVKSCPQLGEFGGGLGGGGGESFLGGFGGIWTVSWRMGRGGVCHDEGGGGEIDMDVRSGSVCGGNPSWAG